MGAQECRHILGQYSCWSVNEHGRMFNGTRAVSVHWIQARSNQCNTVRGSE